MYKDCVQEESAAVEELSTLLQLAQTKKQQSSDKLAEFLEFRQQIAAYVS